KSFRGEHVSEIFYHSLVKVACVRSCIKAVFSETLENFTDMFSVFFQVDENIEHITKNVIDELLKGSWCVSETKGHNTPFEGAIMGPEGGFPFATLSNAD
ncbi:hypothetical protein K439DRAFT_1362586, partial [Ramaria rubella]